MYLRYLAVAQQIWNWSPSIFRVGNPTVEELWTLDTLSTVTTKERQGPLGKDLSFSAPTSNCRVYGDLFDPFRTTPRIAGTRAVMAQRSPTIL